MDFTTDANYWRFTKRALSPVKGDDFIRTLLSIVVAELFPRSKLRREIGVSMDASSLDI